MTFREKVANVLDEGDPLKEIARTLSSKFREVTDYLAEKGLAQDPKPIKEKFTYHVPCHSGWTSTLANAPRELLAKIPGAEFVEMENSEKCCGAGGAFFLEYKDLANGIRSKKKKDIEETGAETIVTQCPSCRYFLDSAFNGKLNVKHPMSLIADTLD